MSDFIFSIKTTPKGRLTSIIESIYSEDPPKVIEYHGSWGSLAISENMHHGFLPIETDEYICFVIGAPLISFVDEHYSKERVPNYSTKEILEKWLKNNQIKWDEDLSGPFVAALLNKVTGQLEIVTDLMSFIPVYEAKLEDNVIVGTHVDILASAAECEQEKDKVSIADFILNGFVTFPYTFYKPIHQLAPASIHRWRYIENKSYKKEYYWKPIERKTNMSLKQTADYLREALIEYVTGITSGMNHIALFISGGEDSRTILSLLPNKSIKDSFIFLDYLNREGKIAKKVSEKFNANFKMVKRPQNYYLDVLIGCCSLVGSGSQSTHVHTFGFHKNCELNRYPAVFGGLFSDALLKGSRIRKIRGYRHVPFIPQIKYSNKYQGKDISSSYINTDVLKAITERHRIHYEWIFSMRPESADEWFELWPSSMNYNIPNIHGNRRLFRSYEPFMSNKVVKISASVPQSWKLNRRLFHHAVKPLLKPVQQLPHSNGWMPYYPWYINTFIYGAKFYGWKLLDKVGLLRGYQGPWSDFEELMASTKWEEISRKYVGETKDNIILREILSVKITKTIDIKEMGPTQKRNLLQVLYFLEK